MVPLVSFRFLRRLLLFRFHLLLVSVLSLNYFSSSHAEPNVSLGPTDLANSREKMVQEICVGRARAFPAPGERILFAN